jgi:L-fuconolactonase
VVAAATEDVLDAQRPIVDPHHHFWERASPYFVPELLKDLQCGHNITGTVFVECAAMYRQEGDPRYASAGEVEYVNGIAAEFASGRRGPVRACAGIVGRADLSLGDDAGPVLQALIARAPDRFRGHPPDGRVGRQPRGQRGDAAATT